VEDAGSSEWRAFRFTVSRFTFSLGRPAQANESEKEALRLISPRMKKRGTRLLKQLCEQLHSESREGRWAVLYVCVYCVWQKVGGIRGRVGKGSGIKADRWVYRQPRRTIRRSCCFISDPGVCFWSFVFVFRVRREEKLEWRFLSLRCVGYVAEVGIGAGA
jgi:hypothetical protein